jgi:protein TonB
MRVSGGVLAQRAVRRPQPPFPIEAIQIGVQGSVVVEVTIATDGTVEGARAVEGPIELRDAAVDAARRWTFKPLELNGEPIRMAGTITFHFRRT